MPIAGLDVPEIPWESIQLDERAALSPRYNAIVCAIPQHNKIVILGGYKGDQPTNDIVTFDCTSNLTEKVAEFENGFQAVGTESFLGPGAHIYALGLVHQFVYNNRRGKPNGTTVDKLLCFSW